MLQFAQMGFPEIYERVVVGPLFRPWAEHLVHEARIGVGDRVLDVACGTGIVARLAHGRVGTTGKVVAVDMNPGMLAVAKAAAPEIDWREGFAEALPIGQAERFNVVTCQQGIQFFGDRSAAVAEMRRVLEPDGRIAVSTWRSDEEVPFLRALRATAEQRLGPIVDQRHAFGDESELEALITHAGFRDVHVRTESQTVRFADENVFLHLNVMALVGMSPAAKDLSESERQQVVSSIVDASRSLVQSLSDQHGIAYDISANVATATA